MENEQTKVCRLCAETIKAAAKVCPYCRVSQRGWFFINIFNLMAILAVVAYMITAGLIASLPRSERIFSPIRDRIEVLSSQLSVNASTYGTNILIVGVLTNGSPYAWQLDGYDDFEVRFFDKDGKTVDSGKSEGSDDKFTILPGSDHSFRIYFRRKTIPEHASYRIYVQSAKDPKALQ